MERSSPETRIAFFHGDQIRRVIHENEWWFVINDVIEVLAASSDPAQYFKRLKERDPELAILTDKEGGTICTTPDAFSGNIGRSAKNVLLEYRRHLPFDSIHPVAESRALQALACQSRL